MSEKRLSRSILVALLLCNVVVYGQTVSFEFLSWDDQQYVVKNLERFGGRLDAASVRWSITNQEHGWRTPISHLSLFLDAQVYGVKSWGMHLTNSLIHSCSTVLLFFVMRKMTGKAIASGIAAAIFAVHPLHVEPVAWVTGRWDLLCGFFWIAGMGAYVNHLQRKTLSSYLCLLILFLFALWSKPTALTFPFCLLLLDLWPLNRIRFSTSAEPDRDDSKLDCLVSPGRAILEKAPLFGIMGV
ncbi:MAG: glycosyltransferase family 39 protein, partial [Planctomycetota bacterium]